MDDDLDGLDRDALIVEIRKLRAGIRQHRDATGHDLCWHHPDLWNLLPEKTEPAIAVPPWPNSCGAASATASRSTNRLRARR